MALVKWNPARDLFRMEKDFNSLFRKFSNKFVDSKDKDEDYELAVWSPLSDIGETEKAYLINLDIPGVEKKDIKLSYKNGVLSVCGERKYEKEKKSSNTYKLEKAYGRYYRSFNLPEHIDEDKIDAELKNGSLRITIPKSEDAKKKQIEIKVN